MTWKSGLHRCRREGCPGWASAKNDHCHQLCEKVAATFNTLKTLAKSNELNEPRREAALKQWDALVEIDLWLNEFAKAFDEYKKVK